jgi:poly(3-hydroxyalkanoate) synthetase
MGKGDNTMITKEQYVNNEVEEAFNDTNFVAEVLREHFYNNVKNLNNKEFKEYLLDLGWDEDHINNGENND